MPSELWPIQDTTVRRLSAWALKLCLLAGTGCLADSNAVAPKGVVQSLRVEPNPYNQLASLVSFSAIAVDSAQVVYAAEGQPALTTPCVRLVSDPARVSVLGLKPNTSYAYHVAACGSASVVSSTVIGLSGSLPNGLEDVSIKSTSGVGSGWTFLSTTRDSVGYLLAFDSTGAIRWYRTFRLRLGEQALDGKQLANGDFSLFIGASQGWQPTFGRYVEVDPNGDVVRVYVAGAPFYTDGHDLSVSFSGANPERITLIGYDLRRVDLSRFGGYPDALVAGHTILRQTASGMVEFQFSAWDHFTLDDWIELPDTLKRVPNTDFDHPNSIDFDSDGNYIVSWRHFGEVTKIDAVTGSILWRLGGRNNQFTFINDPLNGFSGQHQARLLPNGNILLYDNGWRHQPQETRAVEYRLDVGAKTATMVWEFRHTPPLFTGFVGSVQRLAQGNTLIGYGQLGRITEVRSDGSIAWEGQLMFGNSPQTFFYRVVKIVSLYKS